MSERRTFVMVADPSSREACQTLIVGDVQGTGSMSVADLRQQLVDDEVLQQGWYELHEDGPAEFAGADLPPEVAEA